MEPPDRDLVERLADAIADYLRAHPRSKDSLDGIRTCWLGGEHADAPRAAVERAVGVLVSRGVLTRSRLPDGGEIFGSDGAGPRERTGGDP